ncbi:flagellar hook-associated protein FlgL [Undibacterium arcticum]|uniref:Flagellar hook-associated protein FlgL n=1 Tax=Undibacterium arcticum TaxID=1762892 RepID=A0ABV7F6P7_9BURK
MRISTSMLYQRGTARLTDLQAGVDKTMQQISSQRRILTPADDPVGAARVLDVTQSQSVNTQYGTNRQNAKSSLNQVESVLTSVTTLLQDVKESTVSAGNGSYSNTERANIATELRGRLDELMGYANAADGSGNYLFSGFQVATQPFVANPATGAVSYNGDQGQQMLQVDSTRKMATSDSGQAIFQANGQDLFKTMNDMITLLSTPVTVTANTAQAAAVAAAAAAGTPPPPPVVGSSAALAAGLALANGNVDQSLDTVLTVRSSVGSRLKELDSLDDLGSAKGLQYSQTLSTLQDVDYNQAISTLNQQSFVLQAAQKAFASVSNLSLLNFLK